MSDTLESLHRRIVGAKQLESVVRTMKAMAASNIVQYETAVSSLADYYSNVSLGIITYFNQKKMEQVAEEQRGKDEQITGAIVFCSDQGLVGQFNEKISDFVIGSLKDLPGKKEVWTVGERVQLYLSDAGLAVKKIFPVPNSVTAITSLVTQILLAVLESRENNKINELYIFHNHPKNGAGYEPVIQRLLPLDKNWRQDLAKLRWPTKNLPQIVGSSKATLTALMREFFFVSIYRACAESLASENASRLAAMQRAEKKINEIVGDLRQTFNRVRQSAIDEELFDIVAGFEALKEEQSLHINSLFKNV